MEYERDEACSKYEEWETQTAHELQNMKEKKGFL